MRHAAHDARLIAHADLAHVDAHMEARRQLAHQFAEIDACFALEIEHSLIAVQQELDRYRVHVLAGLARHLAEDGHRFTTPLLHLLRAFQILIGGHALHGFQRALQLLDLLGRDLFDIACTHAKLKASRRFDHHLVASMKLKVTGVEPQRSHVISKVNWRYSCHSNHPLFRITACPCMFLEIHYRPASHGGPRWPTSRGTGAPYPPLPLPPGSPVRHRC